MVKLYLQVAGAILLCVHLTTVSGAVAKKPCAKPTPKPAPRKPVCHGKNEVYVKCVSKDNSCFTMGRNVTIPCDDHPSVPGCDCKPGFYRNSQHECVLPEECDCRENEQLDLCYNPCPSELCVDIGKKYHCDPVNEENLHPACRCLKNLRRNCDDICVHVTDCNVNICGANEVLDECPPKDRTCQDVINGVKPCNDPPEDCEPGCRCDKGFIRNDKNECIPEDKCVIPHLVEKKKSWIGVIKKFLKKMLNKKDSSSSSSQNKNADGSNSSNQSSNSTSTHEEVEEEETEIQMSIFEDEEVLEPGITIRRGAPTGDGIKGAGGIGVSVKQEDEFDLFGRSLALQLRTVPMEDALDIEREISNMISQRRIKEAKEKECQGKVPCPVDPGMSSSHQMYTESEKESKMKSSKTCVENTVCQDTSHPAAVPSVPCNSPVPPPPGPVVPCAISPSPPCPNGPDKK